jgi:hypothetical protein
MVTISRLMRTFMRWNGMVVAVEYLTSSPAQPGRARIWATTRAIPA